MDNNPAARIPLGNRLLQLDLGIAQVVGGDVAEDIRGHHAHRGPSQHLVAERAGTIAEHDPVGILLDHPEVALDPPLEID